MYLNDYLRLLAGTVVLASLALGHWVDERFLLLTAFAGLNLLQSAFTRWCPAITALRALGVRDCAHEPAARDCGPCCRGK